MYKIPANTVFIGKNLVYVPECHSTNTLAAELSQKTGTLEGTVVITDRQTAGKGQRGNSWETEPGKNLTLSVILKPSFLAVRDQFNLTVATSLAIQSLLRETLHIDVKIKWPNDILIQDKKICGILIENSLSGEKIQQSIVGIGLNVNQDSFTVATATSMQVVSARQFDTGEILTSLLEKLESYYLQLRSDTASDLIAQYLSHVYWMGEERIFRVNETEIKGTIHGVDNAGRLCVSHSGKDHFYELKEIGFVK